ncbi:hypothetical protein KBW98_23515, partial [Massilia sp. ST3]|nr:hypothetical protein [Massilia sp. ST3]
FITHSTHPARAARVPQPAAADATPAEEGEADAAKPARKKSTRPAHKAPARKPAARGRRPAKPKAGSENG